MGDVISIFDLNSAPKEIPQQRVADDRGEAERRFLDLAAEVGLDMRDVHFGVTQDIVRVHTTDDKPGKKSGWYVIHEEQGLFFGALGNWKSDHAYVKFTGRDERQIDSDLMRRVAERQEQRRRDAEEMKRRNAAEAAEIVRGLGQVSPDHPYLQKKGIRPHGALALGPDLLLPIYDLDGHVISTQTIDPSGGKLFRAGCSPRGVYVIGPPSQNYVICEGFATGASIHELTGMRVYVTFNADNLYHLAPKIAELEGRNGGARPVIAGDNDRPNPQTGECKGQVSAQRAAEAVGGALVLIPEVEGDDWNDVATRDPEGLKKAFGAVRPLFVSWEPIDPALIPRRQWLYGRHYIRKFCSLTVAPGGLGKSTLALVEAIAMATGRNLLGVEPDQRMRVVYFNAEDPMDEIKARVAAVCEYYRIPQHELVGQLFVQSGRDVDLMLAKGELGDLVEAVFQMISGFVAFNGVDLLVLDPLANMHESPETNEVYRRISHRLARMAEQRNIAVEIIHHTRKLNGNEATVEDSRGGSALLGAVRTARVINPMTPEEARKFDLPTHIDHFRIEAAGKNNLARPSEKADWYERHGVVLANGDFIATVKKWEPPNPFEGIKDAHWRQLQASLSAAEEPYRESPQAERWVGHLLGEIVGFKTDDPAGKRRAAAIIDQWLKSDILRVEDAKDEKSRRPVKVVVAGKNL